LAFELLDAAGVRIPTTEAEGHRGNVALIGVPGCDVLRTLVVDGRLHASLRATLMADTVTEGWFQS
jgi:hypothetical protein